MARLWDLEGMFTAQRPRGLWPESVATVVGKEVLEHVGRKEAGQQQTAYPRGPGSSYSPSPRRSQTSSSPDWLPDTAEFPSQRKHLQEVWSHPLSREGRTGARPSVVTVSLSVKVFIVWVTSSTSGARSAVRDEMSIPVCTSMTFRWLSAPVLRAWRLSATWGRTGSRLQL